MFVDRLVQETASKQIINVGEGDGMNYHFRGDLDVAIFPKLLAEER